MAGEDFGAHARKDAAAQVVLRLLDQGRQRFFDAQSRLEQHREPAREQRQHRRGEAARAQQAGAGKRRFGLERVDRDRDETRVPQFRARLPRRLGVDHPAPGASLAVDRDISERRHARFRIPA